MKPHNNSDGIDDSKQRSFELYRLPGGIYQLIDELSGVHEKRFSPVKYSTLRSRDSSYLNLVSHGRSRS